jgi:16S rRNA (cytosine967-C5)-methyltransferase
MSFRDKYGSSSMSDARQIAERVLTRVWGADAFASAVLDAEIVRATALDSRDAGLATELVYGVLRTQSALEIRLQALTDKGKLRLPDRARAPVLMAAYSICFLDRIPTFAAVNEAVAAITATGDTRTASFANAILRKLATNVEQEGRPNLPETIAASAPGWLRGALRRSLGRKDAEAYLAAGPVPPPIGLSLRNSENRDEVIEALQKAAPEATFAPGQTSPRAILVRGAGDVRRLPGAGKTWIIQEEGAQIVALALGAKPGERVLDACAGRGNKSWILADAVGPEGAVDAADLYAAKLEQLRETSWGRALGNTFVVDWSVETHIGVMPPNDYDRVLVDAPCSGMGTLRRRPEIALHRQAEDVERLSVLQTAIVRNAALHVKPGGRLVYAVCSVLREESEQVAEKVADKPLANGRRLTSIPFDGETLETLAPANATMLRIMPHVHGTDGYFMASFVVKE